MEPLLIILIKLAQIFTNIADTLFIMQLCSTIHLYSAHFLSKLSGTTEPGKRQRLIIKSMMKEVTLEEVEPRILV